MRVLFLAMAFPLATLAATSPMAAEAVPDRTILPIQEPKAPLYTELDARNATPPPRFQVKAPDGAPNVLLVLIDDMGFGQSSAFGGPVHMPTVRPLPARASASTSSTPRRFARRRAPPSSAGGTTT